MITVQLTEQDLGLLRAGLTSFIVGLRKRDPRDHALMERTDVQWADATALSERLGAAQKSENRIDFEVEPIEYAQDLIVTVFGVKVIIGKGDEGITVDIWPEVDDGGEAFAGTWVTYQEMGVEQDA